jgi:hypothetical protein
MSVFCDFLNSMESVDKPEGCQLFKAALCRTDSYIILFYLIPVRFPSQILIQTFLPCVVLIRHVFEVETRGQVVAHDTYIAFIRFMT